MTTATRTGYARALTALNGAISRAEKTTTESVVGSFVDFLRNGGERPQALQSQLGQTMHKLDAVAASKNRVITAGLVASMRKALLEAFEQAGFPLTLKAKKDTAADGSNAYSFLHQQFTTDAAASVADKVALLLAPAEKQEKTDAEKARTAVERVAKGAETALKLKVQPSDIARALPSDVRQAIIDQYIIDQKKAEAEKAERAAKDAADARSKAAAAERAAARHARGKQAPAKPMHAPATEGAALAMAA